MQMPTLVPSLPPLPGPAASLVPQGLPLQSAQAMAHSDRHLACASIAAIHTQICINLAVERDCMKRSSLPPRTTDAANPLQDPWPLSVHVHGAQEPSPQTERGFRERSFAPHREYQRTGSQSWWRRTAPSCGRPMRYRHESTVSKERLLLDRRRTHKSHEA